MRRALLLSAYDAGSHRRWRRGVVEHAAAGFDWHAEALPARHYAWRRRGNSLSWAFGPARDALEVPAALVMTTSAVDLSALRGFVPALARWPTIAYFHENQFAYPMRQRARRNALHLQLLDVYTALAADAAWFNSAYNRDTMLQGARDLLGRMPDGVPPEALERLEQIASVVPVGLDRRLLELERPPPDPDRVHLLWSHRWEYDKAPEVFFEALERLVADGLGDRFALHVLGQRFRQAPEIFERARGRLSEQIQTWGWRAERADYEAALSRCDLIVSTALHEFQGLAVLEAMAAGCHAVAPDRLAYREYVDPAWRYPSTPQAPKEEARALAALLADRLEATGWRADASAPRQRAAAWSWHELGPRYLEGFERIARADPATPLPQETP